MCIGFEPIVPSWKEGVITISPAQQVYTLYITVMFSTYTKFYFAPRAGIEPTRM